MTTHFLPDFRRWGEEWLGQLEVNMETDAGPRKKDGEAGDVGLAPPPYPYVAISTSLPRTCSFECPHRFVKCLLKIVL